MAARARLCLHVEGRPGDPASATGWPPALEKLWAHPTRRARLRLNRGDLGFGQEAILAWHEVAAGFFALGGASGGKRARADAETGGKSGVVADLKSLRRAAADVVGDHGAAVGSTRPVAAAFTRQHPEDPLPRFAQPAPNPST